MTAAAADPAARLCAQLEAIFCPALDPALVAAIAYEPGQTLDQASQILSQLLPEEDDDKQHLPPSSSSASSSPHNADTPPTPTAASESAEPSLSESQLHDLLEHWQEHGPDAIPADDDPSLHLTDEDEAHDDLKSDHIKPDLGPKDKVSDHGDREPDDGQDDNDYTLSFLAHAFPRLGLDTLSSTLAAHHGNLTSTLDELVTAQLLADDPGLLPPASTQPQPQDKQEKRSGLDLDQLAVGTRDSALIGKRHRGARRRAADEAALARSGLAPPSASDRTRSAVPIVRLGDVRQGGGGADSRGTGLKASSGSNSNSTGSSSSGGWKDPRQRHAITIPAHLLDDADPLGSVERALSEIDLDHAGSLHPDENKHRTSTSHKLETEGTSSWLLTSSVLTQLVLLLRPIPLSSSSSASTPAILARSKRRLKPDGNEGAHPPPLASTNPPLFSEAEANAVHARASFSLPRTVRRLIRRAADAYDSMQSMKRRAQRATGPSRSAVRSDDEGGGDEDAWEEEKSLAARHELEELVHTLAALSGCPPSRAKLALKATGGRVAEGGDADAALDLLMLWQGVDEQFGGGGARAGVGADADSDLDARDDDDGWTAVAKPVKRGDVRRYLDQNGEGKREAGDEDAPTSNAPATLPTDYAHDPPTRDPTSAIDVQSLPTLAQAARIASTRKAAAALAAQRRAAQTAASVLKRDAALHRSPEAAAQAARDAIARERLAHARKGAALVIPASAAGVGFGAGVDNDTDASDPFYIDSDGYGGAMDGDRVLSLAARRQRALDRLDYASRMETEYREKRREALRKAGAAFRGGASGGGGQSYYEPAAMRARAEVPGSATYFGQPEREPVSASITNGRANPASTSTSTSISTSTSAPRTSRPNYTPSLALAPSSDKAIRGHAAFYYADEARRLDAKARSWGLKAAQALVEERKLARAALVAAHYPHTTTTSTTNSASSSSSSSSGSRTERNVIDLHLLTTGEALAVVKEEVDKWWGCMPRGASSSSSSSSSTAPTTSTTTTSSSTAPATGPGPGPGTDRTKAALGGYRYGFHPLPTPYIGFGPGPLHIITGIGKHSRGHVAVLRPAVCGWLRRGGWDFEEEPARGRIVVRGYKGRAG